jgi:cation transport ATPase
MCASLHPLRSWLADSKHRLDHIVKVVREGQINRAPIERVADQITAYFVPIITLLAILTWTIWLALGLGGVLPPHYLDIGLGGWRKSSSSRYTLTLY